MTASLNTAWYLVTPLILPSVGALQAGLEPGTRTTTSNLPGVGPGTAASGDDPGGTQVAVVRLDTPSPWVDNGIAEIRSSIPTRLGGPPCAPRESASRHVGWRFWDWHSC